MKTLNQTGKLIAPRSLPILAASAIAASVCGESSTVNEWTVVRDTLPSGVERVTNTPPPRTDPTWTLVEEIRVGTLEADRPESFGQLKGMVPLDDGVLPYSNRRRRRSGSSRRTDPIWRLTADGARGPASSSTRTD